VIESVPCLDALEDISVKKDSLEMRLNLGVVILDEMKQL
jgi:hypothetical protein